MKLYRLKINHDVENIDKEFFIVCSNVNAVIDYAKTLGIDFVDYEIQSIELITENVIISDASES
jgi:hypothetical protein